MGLQFKKNTQGKRTVVYRPLAFDFSIIWKLLAFAISWATNKSVGWAIWHTMCGGLYIIYWAITGDNANEAGVTEIINYWKGVFS